jgi:hypothetical protein
LTLSGKEKRRDAVDDRVLLESIDSDSDNQRLALFGRFAITGIHPEKFSGVLFGCSHPFVVIFIVEGSQQSQQGHSLISIYTNEIDNFFKHCIVGAWVNRPQNEFIWVRTYKDRGGDESGEVECGWHRTPPAVQAPASL